MLPGSNVQGSAALFLMAYADRIKKQAPIPTVLSTWS